MTDKYGEKAPIGVGNLLKLGGGFLIVSGRTFTPVIISITWMDDKKLNFFSETLNLLCLLLNVQCTLL